jgi:hypothetical protein
MVLSLFGSTLADVRKHGTSTGLLDTKVITRLRDYQDTSPITVTITAHVPGVFNITKTLKFWAPAC